MLLIIWGLHELLAWKSGFHASSEAEIRAATADPFQLQA